MKRKSHCWVETLVSVQSPLQKLIFGNSCQNLCESRYQNFQVLSSFTWFCYFLQSILSLIVANSTYSGLSNVRFFVSKNVITQKLKESHLGRKAKFQTTQISLGIMSVSLASLSRMFSWVLLPSNSSKFQSIFHCNFF